MNKVLSYAYSNTKRLVHDYHLNQYYKSATLARDYCDTHAVPPLSAQDKMDIDTYWRQFGIHYSDYCFFRMFYDVTGIKDPRFIPDPLAGYVVYPFYL